MSNRKIFDQAYDDSLFTFTIPNIKESEFSVIQCEGIERLSKKWEITLYAAGTAVFETLDNIKAQASDVLHKSCILDINSEISESTRKYSGIITSFSIITEMDTDIFLYKITMESELFSLSQKQNSKIYMSVNVVDIIEDVLKRYPQITYRLSLKHKDDSFYALKKYIVQKDETDDNFLHRLLEHWGIFYYTREEKQSDGETKQTLIITDSMPDNDKITLNYGQYGKNEPETLFTISQHVNQIPSKIIVKDYNYRSEKISIDASANTASTGTSEEVLFNENVTTQEEAKNIAELRAELHNCNRIVFSGSTNSLEVIVSQSVSISGHPFYTDNYFITETTFHSSLVSKLQKQFQVYFEQNQNFSTFRCQFNAIKEDTPFRPSRTASIPKQESVNSAIISNQDQINDSESKNNDDYITTTGEFLLKDNRFDYMTGEPSKTFSTSRTVTPDVGVGHEISFPHKNNDEVMVFYERGDFSRPVIVGSVFNAIANPLVTSSNSNTGKIKLPGKNELIISDTQGDDNGILLKSDKNDSYLAMGDIEETRKEKNAEDSIIVSRAAINWLLKVLSNDQNNNSDSDDAPQIPDIDYGIVLKTDEAMIQKVKNHHHKVWNHSFKNVTGASLEIVLGYHGRWVFGLYTSLLYGATIKGNLIFNKLNTALEHFSEGVMEKVVAKIPVKGEHTIVTALEAEVGGDIDEAVGEKIRAAMTNANAELLKSRTYLQQCQAKEQETTAIGLRSDTLLEHAEAKEGEVNLSVTQKKDNIVAQQTEAEEVVQSAVTQRMRSLSSDIQGTKEVTCALILQGE